MGACLAFNVMLSSETCCNCGIEFAMPASFQQKKRENGGSFYCPNGHGQHYSETEVDRLKKQLDAEQRKTAFERNQRRETEKQLAKARTKIARVNHGVCPHCNRTFRQLAQHMKSKHAAPVQPASRVLP